MHARFVYKYRFHNGGLIFSTTLLSVIAIISLYSFLLLVETRNKVPMSFGDIGGVLFGQTMRMAVLFSITISQVSFLLSMELSKWGGMEWD